MESRQSESYDRIQLILDSAPMSVTLYDSTYSLIDCNMESVRMFGLSNKEHFIKEWNGRFYDFFPPYQACGTETKKKTSLMFEKAASEGRTQFDWMHLTADGEELPTEVTLVRIDHQNAPMFVAYVRDLRLLKMLEKQRLEIAEESQRSKSRFLARMSHEVRTPLNAVMGAAEIQLQKGGHPPDTEEAFLRIHNSSRLLLRLINDIFDISKVEPGEMEGVSAEEVLGMEVAESQQDLKSTQAHLKRIVLHNHEPMPYGRVLVVDDVESNLYVAKHLLLPYGLAIQTAESALEAIARVKNGQFYDIIFMDHMMPGMDGIEAMKALRELGYNRPIVALTANATSSAAEMFMDNGFSGFIPKPINPADLDIYLMRFIRDKQPAEVIEAARHAIQVNVSADEFTDSLKPFFLLDAKKAISVLEPLMFRQEIDSASCKMLVITTHAMKSALFNIGYAELSREAAALEQAGRNKNEEAIRKLTPPFLESVREIIQDFSQDCEDKAPDFDDDTVFLRERLFAISDACEAYDQKIVSDLLNELRSKPSSRQTRSLLDTIDGYLLLSEFEDAAIAVRQAAELLENESSVF